MKKTILLAPQLACAALLCCWLPAGSFARDVREDAVFRLTFQGDSANDIAGPDISQASVTGDLTFTSDLPPMANSSGRAAVFNGTNTMISYGLGANNELKIESAFTYHARVRYDAVKLAQGRPEQWIMGRVRSLDQGVNTRVTALTTDAAGVGSTNVNNNAGCSIDGKVWNGGTGTIINTNASGLPPGVFHDLFLRYEPGVAVTLAIFNAETGAMLSRVTQRLDATALLDANTPFELGDRAAIPGARFAGEMEQINVWNRALSDDEMAALSGDPGFSALSLIQNLQPTNGAAFLPATTEIRFISQSQTNIPVENISVLLNGVDRSSELVITGSLQNREVKLSNLSSNMSYHAQITVTDAGGASKKATLDFNTFSEGVIFIEAEDYNFDGGQFINNPALSSVPASDNYLDRMSIQGIDRYIITNSAGPKLYRIGDGVATSYSVDFQRKNFADAHALDPAIEDYYVGWLNFAWLNYTRVFPSGVYQVFARLADPSRNQFDATLSAVTAGATTPDQTVFPLGTLRLSATGGSQVYAFVQLADCFGKPAPLFLQGQKTLRFTLADPRTCNFNYLMFVPSQAPAAAYVSSVSPRPGETDVLPDTVITANLLNQATQVTPQSVQLLLSGQNVTAQATLTPIPEGLRVSFHPGSLPSLSLQTVTLIFADNATPPNWSTNTWQFTVRRAPGADTPEIFADAALRVTFKNSADDQTTGNVSTPITATDLSYTTALPPMANSDGTAAVFNGTSSFLSYGLGANNELKIESAFTYHVRLRFDAAKIALGRSEQYLVSRFRSATNNDTRISHLSAPAVAAGATKLTVASAVNPTGKSANWNDGKGNAQVTSVPAGVFCDLFETFAPGVAMTLTVFNAETGALVGKSTVPVTSTNLLDADTPFDVGNTTRPGTMPFVGEIEQLNVWRRVLSDNEMFAISRGTANPVTMTYTLSGSKLTLDWPAGQGWQLQAQTNGLTGKWLPVPGATPPYTITIDPTAGSLFYRLQY